MLHNGKSMAHYNLTFILNKAIKTSEHFVKFDQTSIYYLLKTKLQLLERVNWPWAFRCTPL